MTAELNDLEIIGQTNIHSHITSLGIENNTIQDDCGLIGQERPRFALSLSKEKSKITLLSGKTNTGKSALAIAFSKEVSNPVCISATQINNLAHLDQFIRHTQKVVLKEETTVIEGEIVSISNNLLTLRTTEMESAFTVRETMGFSEGDVLQIANGTIKRIGNTRMDNHADPNVMLVDTPQGKLTQKRMITKTCSLLELEENNSKNADRFLIDEKILGWVDQGKAEFLNSTLIIEDAHLMERRSLEYLFTISELNYTPFLLLVSSEGEGEETKENNNIELNSNEEKRDIEDHGHGGANNLFDAYKSKMMLRIATQPLTDNQKRQIFKLRASAEQTTLSDEIVDILLEIERGSNIKYVINIITMLGFFSSSHQRDPNVNDLKCLCELFMNVNELKVMEGCV